MLTGTTNYTLHGKNIVNMTQGNNVLHFFYDASNKPAIVEYNGTKYAYVHNLQGDIVAILDSNGTAVVQYKYDAWGKPISKTGSMASTLGTVQPFRYRGYVYDEETGLYYLRSRYYNPSCCRFVNADALIFSDTRLLMDDQYLYCRNNPICRIDNFGYEDNWAMEKFDDEVNVTPENTELAGGYHVPSGGGGPTNIYQIGETTYTFGHGGRHMSGSTNLVELENAIISDISNKGLVTQSVGYHPQTMIYNGNLLFYGAYVISPVLINVGTYYYVNLQ